MYRLGKKPFKGARRTVLSRAPASDVLPRCLYATKQVIPPRSYRGVFAKRHTYVRRDPPLTSTKDPVAKEHLIKYT